MAVLKCKMCGAPLNLTEGATVVECEYCGTKQTLSKTQDARIATMFERANQYRLDNEFDKAMSLYEKILLEDSTDAEAYWGLLLSKFGIEYVDDETQHRRVPTINRMQTSSILSDSNYLHAVEYADAGQKIVYEHDAKEIANIQKGIAEISQKEEPFDVFICYKETDANGRRTRDSVLATELYHELTKEGFEVFFSRITLEDKIGSAYEPYIFAALNSASVMVVLGTTKEYFNAVWTRNEWSRFLALIKQGKKKTLIPAYKDMDPYDLPVEFANLQSQDMGKLGFMQDLIRGIKKIVTGTKGQHVAKVTTVANVGARVNPTLDSLLTRAKIALADSDFEAADAHLEKALDIDAKCAEAYLGKLLADLKLHEVEELVNTSAIIENNPNFRHAMEFGSEKLQSELSQYVDKQKKHLANVARNVLGNQDWQKVDRYYNLVLGNSPNSIEANFFSVFGKIMLCIRTSDYSTRQKNFEILCKTIASIHTFYNSTSESQRDVLNLISRNIIVMYRSGYIYNPNSKFGGDFWHVSLMNRVKETFCEELKKIYEQNNETYITELISKTENCVKIRKKLRLTLRSILWILVCGGLAYFSIKFAMEVKTTTSQILWVVASIVFVLIEIGIFYTNLHPVIKVNE